MELNGHEKKYKKQIEGGKHDRETQKLMGVLLVVALTVYVLLAILSFLIQEKFMEVLALFIFMVCIGLGVIRVLDLRF